MDGEVQVNIWMATVKYEHNRENITKRKENLKVYKLYIELIWWMQSLRKQQICIDYIPKKTVSRQILGNLGGAATCQWPVYKENH